MWNKFKQFVFGLLYENNEPSLTRFIALTAFLAFLAGSAYLMLRNQTWAHYSEFASLTGGGGAVTQIANKLINSKNNSADSQPFIKNNQGGNQK